MCAVEMNIFGKSVKVDKNEDFILHLYHGSKGGIQGMVQPISRKSCDFGAGFYMGTNREQSYGICCGKSFPNRRFYCVSLDISNLNVLRLSGVQWLVFICYNRFLQVEDDTVLSLSCRSIHQQYDVIIGDIADDSLRQAITMFQRQQLSDVALYKALSMVPLGKQYVAVSSKGCAAVHLEEEDVGVKELERLRVYSQQLRDEGDRVLSMLPAEYRRLGRFYAEYESQVFNRCELLDLPCSWGEILRGDWIKAL